MLINLNTFRLLALFFLALVSCSLIASEKKLQLLARYDVAQPALQLAEPISSEFRHHVLKVAVAGQPQPPLFMDIDTRRFEGVSADYLSLIQNMLDTTIEIHYYASHSAAQEAVTSGEMQLLAIYVEPPSVSKPQTLIASDPWMLDYAAIGFKSEQNAPLKIDEPNRMAWSGSALMRAHLEETFKSDLLVRFPGYYDAVAATVFGQTERVWGNAATLTHLNRFMFANALEITKDDHAIPMNFSFGISPRYPQLAEAINFALTQIPLSIRMQIAKRWQLDTYHVLQRNPLALKHEEEKWLQAHPRINTALPQTLAPLSSRNGSMPFRGMIIDVLDLIANQSGITFNSEVQEESGRNQTDKHFPHLYALEMLTPDMPPQLITRPWLVSHWVIIRHKRPRNIMARDPFPFGSALMLNNRQMKDWMLLHYPHLNLAYINDPLQALRELQAHEIDAVVLPKIFVDYLLHNHNADDLIIETTLGADPARFVMRVEPGNETLISILNKALIAIPPETMFKLLAHWRQSEMPFLSASWQS